MGRTRRTPLPSDLLGVGKVSFNFDTTITLSLIFTILLAVIGWVRMHNAAVAKRIDGCGERLDRHEQRIHSAEQSLQSMPSKDDLHGVKIALSDMGGDMREMRALVQGQAQIMQRVETVVSRQEDHLMRKTG